MTAIKILVTVMTLPGQSDKDLEESGFMEGSSQEGVIIISSGHLYCILSLWK